MAPQSQAGSQSAAINSLWAWSGPQESTVLTGQTEPSLHALLEERWGGVSRVSHTQDTYLLLSVRRKPTVRQVTLREFGKSFVDWSTSAAQGDFCVALISGSR